eukprot:scaffold18210_cov74-Phaeocystis_antarctica.AAC.1
MSSHVFHRHTARGKHKESRPGLVPALAQSAPAAGPVKVVLCTQAKRRARFCINIDYVHCMAMGFKTLLHANVYFSLTSRAQSHSSCVRECGDPQIARAP